MSNTTKERLIIEAFKLFASKPYDQVTYSDLEKVTNLSRGAIMYHVKTKENLFVDVMRYFIFHTPSVLSIRTENTSLKDFILACVDECSKEVENLRKIEVQNINLVKLNIESQGFYFYPEMKAECVNWSNEQYSIWESVIKHSISKNEIRPVAEVHAIASLFINHYLGISYAGIIRDNGTDLEELKNNMLLMYDLLKK